MPSSTPPTRRCSAEAVSTALSTVRQAPTSFTNVDCSAGARPARPRSPRDTVSRPRGSSTQWARCGGVGTTGKLNSSRCAIRLRSPARTRSARSPSRFLRSRQGSSGIPGGVQRRSPATRCAARRRPSTRSASCASTKRPERCTNDSCSTGDAPSSIGVAIGCGPRSAHRDSVALMRAWTTFISAGRATRTRLARALLRVDRRRDMCEFDDR